MDSGFGRSLPRHRVVAVERNALRNQRNIEFHATIGKNHSCTYDADGCGEQLSTESHEGNYFPTTKIKFITITAILNY